MTDEQIAALSPGMALNCAVAEARGWRWWRSSSSGRRCLYPSGSEPPWMDTPADGTEAVVFDIETIVPDFSAGAWPIQLLTEAELKLAPTNRRWEATTRDGFCAHGQTPNEAIAKAYILHANFERLSDRSR